MSDTSTKSYELLLGNALDRVQDIPRKSVQTCVTSPPYWGLRDYGDPGQDWPAVEFSLSLGGLDVPVTVPAMKAPLGLESTPIAYVAHLVAIFREVRDVLADDGTLWLNIGDSYAAHSDRDSRQGQGGIFGGRHKMNQKRGRAPCSEGLKPKDLVGIPWLLAFALRSDGWYLRSDVIWHKRNPMPESVTDRPTKGHEYVFLLAKSARYHCDMGALKTPWMPEQARRVQREAAKGMDGGYQCQDDIELGKRSGSRTTDGLSRQKGDFTEAVAKGRNARTVWIIASQPYKHHGTSQHFAVMPPELARRCIVAGARPGDTVLDPFAGAATVGKVAIEQGREFVGIELSPEYAKIGIERMDRARVKVGAVTAEDAKVGQQVGLFD